MFEFAMYYLSYLPLWASIVFIDVVSIMRNEDYPWTEWISIVVIPIGIFICSLITYRWIKRTEKQNVELYMLEDAKEVRFVTAEFLMSYVIPLYAFEFTKWDGVVLFFVFFCVFWFLVFRHKYFRANLALEICGYRIYDCELLISGQKISKRVVSRKELPSMIGETIHNRKYNNDYHFEVG